MRRLQQLETGRQISRVICWPTVAFKFSDNLTLLSNTAVSAGNLLSCLRQTSLETGPTHCLSGQILTDGRSAHRRTVSLRNLVSKRLNKLVDLEITVLGCN